MTCWTISQPWNVPSWQPRSLTGSASQEHICWCLFTFLFDQWNLRWKTTFLGSCFKHVLDNTDFVLSTSDEKRFWGRLALHPSYDYSLWVKYFVLFSLIALQFSFRKVDIRLRLMQMFPIPMRWRPPTMWGCKDLEFCSGDKLKRTETFRNLLKIQRKFPKLSI